MSIDTLLRQPQKNQINEREVVLHKDEDGFGFTLNGIPSKQFYYQSLIDPSTPTYKVSSV